MLQRHPTPRGLGRPLALLVAAVLATLPAAASAVRADAFAPGTVYSGGFADPTLWRAGGRWYAAATNTAGRSLPVLTSTDLTTWAPRESSDPLQPWLNDAMPTGPSWSSTMTFDGRTYWPTWAPSVLAVRRTGWVAALSLPRRTDLKRCIALARSDRPEGPYRPIGTAPLTCVSKAAIDPQLFASGRRLWLVLKTKDRSSTRAGRTTHLVVRRLNDRGTGFARRSRFTTLLTSTAQDNGVVENPAMIRYAGRLYLFFSTDGYWTDRYSTGYAVCRSVTGPCRRMGRVLTPSPELLGPGGATPFLDDTGALRLIFHTWNPDHTRRPMRLATIVASRDGHLTATDLPGATG